MAMERENYRLNLEAVIAVFPDKNLLAISYVSEYLGKDTRNVRKIKDLMKMFITIGTQTFITRESLAHWLSGK